jgi:hypothetical protein
LCWVKQPPYAADGAEGRGVRRSGHWHRAGLPSLWQVVGMQIEKGLHLSRTRHPQPLLGRWWCHSSQPSCVCLGETHLSPLVPVSVNSRACHLHIRDGVPLTSSCGPVALLWRQMPIPSGFKKESIITRRHLPRWGVHAQLTRMASHQCVSLIRVAGLGNEDRIAQQCEGDRAQQMSRLLHLLVHRVRRTWTGLGGARWVRLRRRRLPPRRPHGPQLVAVRVLSCAHCVGTQLRAQGSHRRLRRPSQAVVLF